MTDVLFYHLEKAPVEQVLPTLLEKSLERGWRASVIVGPEGSLQAMDEHLWTYRDDGFIPHGIADEPGAERHPVVLGLRNEKVNEANVLFLITGARAENLSSYDRCVDLFNGRDEIAVSNARERFREAKNAGHAVTYWKQDSAGRWEQKA